MSTSSACFLMNLTADAPELALRVTTLMSFLMAGPSPGKPLVESKFLAGCPRQTPSPGALSWLEPTTLG